MRIDTQPSFAQFVYPFLFDPATFAARIEAVDAARGTGKRGEYSVWTADHFPEDDVLAPVARFLNPPPGRVPTARLWSLAEEGMETWGLRGRAYWELVVGKDVIPFRLGDQKPHEFAVELVLFQDGVGFLTLNATPTSDEADDWLKFIHYFRFVEGQRGALVRAKRRTGKDQFEYFYPEPAGGAPENPDGSGTVGRITAALLQTARQPDDSGQWWNDVYIPGQLLPYAALFVDGAEEAELPLLRYRLRNFFPPARQIIPSTDDCRDDHPSMLCYTDGAWFLFSLEGGAFLACDVPENDFFRVTLPDHIRNAYFLLFLLALHQRFFLMSLSEDIAENWCPKGNEPSVEQREQVFAQIRNLLLSFTARGYFSQVMQRHHHHQVYRRWLQELQVDQLYREVQDEVRHMHEFLSAQKDERLRQLQEAQEQRTASLEKLLAAIATIIGLPSLGLAFLGAIGGATVGTAAIVTAGLLLAGVILYLALARYLARRHRSTL